MSPWDGIEERVVQAYKARGLKARTIFYRLVPARSGEGMCCCGLGALYNERFTDHKIQDDGWEKYNHDIAAELGVSIEDLEEFMYGFDNGLTRDTLAPAPKRSEAFVVGFRAARAVAAAGLVA